MAYDGLKPTGKQFGSVTYVLQAHYPKITDYVETVYDSYYDALDSAEHHAKQGANVQIHKHHWVETFTALHSFAAKKGTQK